MRACRMRFSTVAAAVCLSLSAVAGGFAAAPPAQRADVPGAAAPATPAPATHAAPSPGDAAAKHARRTACLKDAKTKKLVGAEKTSFLKTCIAAP
jgi:psiF repeat